MGSPDSDAETRVISGEEGPVRFDPPPLPGREDDIATARPDSVSNVTAPGRDEATMPAGGDAPDKEEPSRSLKPGDCVGSFVVERELGAGAMGVVVLAHDRELDRPVAVKLLKTDEGDPEAHARLIREAQSAARIQHPNVVAVHQVGTHAGQVYVVMEYVDGGTLREWIEGGERSWAEVVDVYRQAGRGLAAAHAAGLVHRDFKPDNVLIGHDGRVRVSDFGLVGLTGDLAEQATTLEFSGSGSGMSGRLTRTGAIMGTPAYMPPEQYSGERIEARSDQFSFCVSLFEALYGTRPFHAESLAAMAAAVGAGRIVDLPPTEVPPVVHAAVVKGLAPVPASRHAGMDELLTALNPSPKGRSKLPLIAAGVLATGLAGGAYVAGAERETPIAVPGISCNDAAEAFGEAYGESRRAALKAGLAATDSPGQADVFAFLDEELTAHRGRWIAAHDEACEAARVRGEQTEAIFDMRRACLTEIRDEADVFSELLASGDERLVDGAISSVTLLRPIGTCADVEALQAAPMPTVEQREGLAPLRRELTRGHIMLLAGRHHDVIGLGKELEPKMRAVGFEADLASTLVLLARAEMQLGEFQAAEARLREAITLAAKARAYAVEARATATLMYIVGPGQGRYDEAVGMIPAGESAAQRSSDPRARSYLSASVGTIRVASGDHDAAMKSFDESIATLEALERPPPDELGNAYSNRAGLKLKMGDKDGAVSDHETALATIEAGLGKRHPFYGALALSLGKTLQEIEDHERALAYYEASLHSWEALYGRDHTSTALAQLHVAQAHAFMGDFARAQAALEDSLARHERAEGDDPRGLISIVDNLAWVAYMDGRWEDSQREYTRARDLVVESAGLEDARVPSYDVAIAGVLQARGDIKGSLPLLRQARASHVKRYGPKHADVAHASTQIGDAYLALGECGKASEHYRAALRLRADLGLGADARLAQLLAGVGTCELAAGDRIAATDSLQRALSLLDEVEIGGESAARVRFASAKLAWAGDERERALELAGAALDGFKEIGAPVDFRLRAVEAWLAKRR